MNTLVNFKKNTEKIFEIAKDKDLNGREISLLMAINELSDNEINSCFASNDTLGNMVNLSANRISYVLKCLAQKGLIVLTYAPKGQPVTVNGKNYVNYRLIRLNLPLIANDKTPLTENDNPPLSKTVTNNTKNNNTKNNNINLSKEKVINKNKIAPKIKTKKRDKRDSQYAALFKYAMILIKNRKSIGNKHAYAFTIVKNWLKAGLNTVEKVKKDQNQHNSFRSNQVIIEKVPESIKKQQALQANNDKKPKTKDSDEKIMSDITYLMQKLMN